MHIIILIKTVTWQVLIETLIWQDYSYGQDMSFDIDVLNVEDEAHQHDDSQEEQQQAYQEEQASDEENSHEWKSTEITLQSVVIYNGFIYM